MGAPWTGLAHLLADDIREPGFTAAAVTASAWQARVDPQATHGLVGAALALAGNGVLSALWSPLPPCPDDTTFLHWTSDLEARAAELLEHCRRMARDCEAALAAAAARAHRALALLASAATPDAEADAGAMLTEARAEIADCDAALEILADCESRLAHALNCLRRVPDDLAATYEKPYELVHAGGKLPYSGDFLTAVA